MSKVRIIITYEFKKPKNCKIFQQLVNSFENGANKDVTTLKMWKNQWETDMAQVALCIFIYFLRSAFYG